MKPILTTYRKIFTRALLSNGEGEFHVIGATHTADVFDREFINDKNWGDDREIAVVTKDYIYLLDDVVTGEKFVRIISRRHPCHPWHLSALPFGKKDDR